MSHILKFRVWNGETMVSPDYIDREGRAWWKENSIPTSSDELMQFTGLKDVNGKEIYEGDICLCPSDSFGRNYLVRWAEARGGWWYEPIAILQQFGGYLDFETAIQDEVIGNIYENPELLEAKR